jgi:predicted Rossmann fold flavoprotein
MQNYDAVIVGAGGAGLFCALRAGQRGKRVLLLDHAAEVGAKILISGGGRCNFTNRNIAADRYISQNPHFCKSALKSYTQFEFIELVEKHRIAYHEKTLGQLFCDGSASEIVSMLLKECHAGAVELKVGQKITSVTKADHFSIATEKETFTANAVVLATGGLSIPKMGATSFAYDTARQFGLKLVETRPALVPLTFADADLEFMKALTGISLPVYATSGKHHFREDMVFTHRGLSGPAILQVSSYWREGGTITLDLLPDTNVEAYLIARKKERPNAELKTVLGELLPQRLAQAFVTAHSTNVAMSAFTDKKLKDFAHTLKNWTLPPSGTEGYAKAEVTSGGIDTDGLSSKTMQANDVPGLYVIGEAADVTGWLGGYNFQWAWSSGWAAGSAL